MPVYFDIRPDLNLIIYVCLGTVNAVEFYRAADAATFDARLTDDMKIIIDLFSAQLDAFPSDLPLALRKKKQMDQEGRKLGQTAVITKSSGLKFMADALKLMSSQSPVTIDVFHNIQDALIWLGLLDIKEEVIQFLTDFKRESMEKVV